MLLNGRELKRVFGVEIIERFKMLELGKGPMTQGGKALIALQNEGESS